MAIDDEFLKFAREPVEERQRLAGLIEIARDGATARLNCTAEQATFGARLEEMHDHVGFKCQSIRSLCYLC